MQLDKGILIEYADMKQEIKDLRCRIDGCTRELEKLNKMVVADSVTCGKKGKRPLRTVKIQGKPTDAIHQKGELLEKHIVRLHRLEIECMELTIQAEEYIERINKSELRTMFRQYFIDDLSYPQVAERMNVIYPKRRIKYTDENVRKRIQRFLKMSHNVRI